MSYQVIARKWRPQAFDEVTGQETVTTTLKNAIEFDRLHHAYLFSGARGVGKTTTARLFAKALNCHKTDKPNIHPCSTNDPTACVSCVEISESRSIDVLEIDAASHTGIDSVRETILENININPARDRYKVFIIDEVHQLSRPAFNALLKTLEEPPGNVVFIMATTELHKVPDTILSRCQEFIFRTIAPQKIFDRLKLIAEAEKIAIDDASLWELARSGEGSMRDAQSNFDQVISFSGEKITIDDVTRALGIADVSMLKRVITGVAAQDAKAILAVVDEMVSRGQDLRNFCRDVLGLIRDLLVQKVTAGSTELFEGSGMTSDDLKLLAEPFSESDLIRFFNSISETESKLRDAVNSRYALEMGLVKLAEMKHLASIETILERLANLEKQPDTSRPETLSSAAAAAPEKKTLVDAAIADREPESYSDPVIDVSVPPSFEAPDLSFLQSPPLKIAPISSEDLQHVDDAWLDAEFENRLTREGEQPGPIPNISDVVSRLSLTQETKAATSGNGNGLSQTASLVNVEAYMPKYEEPTDNVLPKLSENPTQEELLAYAHAHPLIRHAIRTFRAKIVEIKKISD
jgi:DNA polymerase-3 subunit gamma/tau